MEVAAASDSVSDVVSANSGTSSAGTSSAGTSSAGTSSAGTSSAGASSASASTSSASASASSAGPTADPSSSMLLQLAQQIRRGDSVVFVTGSGLSAPSGIPTFRGAEGVWARWVLEWGTRAAFLSNPRDWWNRFWIPAHVVTEPGSTIERQYEPSGGHFAIAQIAAATRTNVRVVTQNIDQLHTRGGLPKDRCIEIHGRSAAGPRSPSERAARCAPCAAHVLGSLQRTPSCERRR
jgi:hypothetical protein